MHATQHFFDDALVWQQQSSALIAQEISDVIDAQGHCTLGLSGGSTPAPVYRALATEAINWSKVTLFLADERYVPPTDPQSNQFLVRTTLLDHLPVQPITLFPDTSLPPDACAEAYDTQLRNLLTKNGADILVLGLGLDGHTASLFPPVDTLFPDRFAIHARTDQSAVHDRISITPRVLRSAHIPLILLQGSEKIAIWNSMLTAPNNPTRWPLQDVVAAGKTILFACS